jgi:hypothetical protein
MNLGIGVEHTVNFSLPADSVVNFTVTVQPTMDFKILCDGLHQNKF